MFFKSQSVGVHSHEENQWDSDTWRQLHRQYSSVHLVTASFCSGTWRIRSLSQKGSRFSLHDTPGHCRIPCTHIHTLKRQFSIGSLELYGRHYTVCIYSTHQLNDMLYGFEWTRGRFGSSQVEQRNEIIMWPDWANSMRKKRKKKMVLMDVGKKQCMHVKELLSDPPAIIWFTCQIYKSKRKSIFIISFMCPNLLSNLICIFQFWIYVTSQLL